jgi:hypothetical protein
MFTMENTEGFTQSEIDLLNAALEIRVSRGEDEKDASDAINNLWQANGNTIESLTAN